MTTLRKTPATIIAALAAALLAACASSGAAAPGAGGQGTPGGGALTVADLAPFSGADAALGPTYLVSCDAATQAINNAGGVLGRKLSCKGVDTRGDPADAVPATRQMLSTTPGLSLVIGCTSDEAASVVPVLGAAKIVSFCMTGQSEFDAVKYPYFFRLVPPDLAESYAMVVIAQQLGYHKIARFPLHPGFHSMPCAEIAVNLDKWNALGPELQAILEMATRDFARDMVQRIALEDQKVVETAKAQGVTLIAWSGEERKKFRELSRLAWADWAKKSPMSKRTYDSQVAFLKKLQLID